MSKPYKKGGKPQKKGGRRNEESYAKRGQYGRKQDFIDRAELRRTGV
jgi:hypothetical protein